VLPLVDRKRSAYGAMLLMSPVEDGGSGGAPKPIEAEDRTD
jgi:hypothetical protein